MSRMLQKAQKQSKHTVMKTTILWNNTKKKDKKTTLLWNNVQKRQEDSLHMQKCTEVG